MNDSFLAGLILVIKIVYAITITLLSIYGLNSLGLALLYLFNRKRVFDRSRLAVELPKEWPRVTIQLPLYNESVIVERLLEAVTRQDYPRDCFQIQVLDDSTDETTSIAQVIADRYKAEGFQIELIHRVDRTGYKAGALQNGLKTATGEFVAVFDADFVPPPFWLKTVIPQFNSDEVGCVQTRWGHLNSSYNLLTRIETLMLDGHFIVEQCARYGSNLFMGFNGSGGIWRKACIADAGGWASDTLTEDLDLSYRAQLNGWRIKYLPDIVVPGELPVQIDAFKGQQYRWAKGSVQTFRKLAKDVLTAPIPWRVRLAAILHLSMYFPFPFVVLALLLTLPIALFASDFLMYFPFSMVASVGPPFLYAVSRTSHLPRWRDRLVRLPLLSILGLGISFNTGLAVLSGLIHKGGVFNRTPKYNIKGKRGNWVNKYALPRSPVVWFELLLSFYAGYTIYTLWDTTIGKAITPGMLLYAVSFFFVAALSFLQSWHQSRARSMVETGSPSKIS